MKLKNVLLKAITGQIIIDVLVAVTFYFLIPSLMNYAPYSIELNLVEEYLGISYLTQALFMFVPYIIIMFIFLMIYLKDMIKYGKSTINNIPQEIKNSLSEKLLKTPVICYFIKIVCIPISVIVTLVANSVPLLIVLKLTIIITVFFILDGAIIYTFFKKSFRNLLKEINNFETIYGKKIKIKSEISVQFISVILASLSFIMLLSYSRIIEEKGDAIYSALNNKLTDYFNTSELNFADKDIILSELKSLFNNDSNYTFFCVEPNKNLTVLGEEKIPDFTENLYISKMVQIGENRIYDISKEHQGIIETVNTIDGMYVYGVFFNIIPYNSMNYFIYTMLVLMTLSIIITIYYGINMSKNISEVTSAIENVVSGNEVDYDKKLPVTSNDEIGELIVSFNKILDLEKKNMETKERNQEIMVEQERLSSLGQLIGGIAHNLKTPIMSIAGAVEGLTDLVKEYDESIEDPKVTKEDHHEIAKDMQVWVDKIKPYLSYMTEVIDTVKGQAVSMNASTMRNFTAKELIARTQILLRDELKRRHCTLNLNLEVNEGSNIAGEISAIVQVIDNLIINAMDAYKEDGGNIDIYVHEDEHKIFIEVKDYAGGIPESVQDKLFKEMITSKGKNGTGLGLYMSYSTIKGKFNGDMYYKTEKDKGTTFFIELNKYKEQ